MAAQLNSIDYLVDSTKEECAAALGQPATCTGAYIERKIHTLILWKKLNCLVLLYF